MLIRLFFRPILDLFTDSQPIDLLTSELAQLRKNGSFGDFLARWEPFNNTELTSQSFCLSTNESSTTQESYTEHIQIKREMIRFPLIFSGMRTRDYRRLRAFWIKWKQSPFWGFHEKRNIRKNYSTWSPSCGKQLIELESKKAPKKKWFGLSFHQDSTALDRVTLRLAKRIGFVFIAARPAMGKTAFVLSCTSKCHAVDHNKPVAIFPHSKCPPISNWSIRWSVAEARIGILIK